MFQDIIIFKKRKEKKKEGEGERRGRRKRNCLVMNSDKKPGNYNSLW